MPKDQKTKGQKPMPKDQKTKSRERKIPMQIYLNDKEKYILEEKAKLAGMTSSALIRQLIIQGFVYDIDYSELQKYNENLSKIGTNLNQIAKRINATGNTYAEDVSAVKKLMEEVWHTQKSMLSSQPYLKQ